MSGAGCAQICGACVETVGEGKEQEWERSERCVVCSVWSVCGGAKARFGRSERKCAVMCGAQVCGVCVWRSMICPTRTPPHASLPSYTREEVMCSHTPRLPEEIR